MRRAAPAVRPRRPVRAVLLLASAVALAPAPAHAGISWYACPEPGSPGDFIGSERYVVVATEPDDSLSGGKACTVRDAIATAEAGTAQAGCVVDEVGGPVKGDPWAVVIEAPITTYTLDGTQLTWGLGSGSSSFVLCGRGADVTEIRAAASPGTAGHRVLQLSGPGTLKVWGVSFANGVAPAPPFDSLGTSDDVGGGISVLPGAFLELHDSRIHHNLAAANGGGLACDGGTGPCYAIVNSVIDHNGANGYGGGVYGLGYFESSILRNNVAGIRGGGLYTLVPPPPLSGPEDAVGFGGVYMRNTLIASNAAGSYGGGWYNAGFGWAESVTISDNSAVIGGGLVIEAPVQPEYLTNLTVSGNRAEQQVSELGAAVLGDLYRVAGVWVLGSSTVELNHATIFGNENLPPVFLEGGASAGVGYGAGLVADDTSNVTYLFSVIAGNLDDGSPYDCELNIASGSGGANRVGSTCDMSGIGDALADPADLLPLADNGGSTASLVFPFDRTLPDGSFLPTHALVEGADMIDAAGSGETCVGYLGSPGQPLLADARGFGRYDGDGDGTRDCDIGAYEYGGEKVIWIDGFEVEFVSPCNWSTVNDPVLCSLK